MNQFQPMAPSAYMPMPQPYQPYQPPYPPTPTRAMPQISGRVVNSLDDITVQEVPTDGTVAAPSTAASRTASRSRPTSRR